MRSETAFANQLLRKHLLNSAVESFGLSHQFLTLTFRDVNAEDHTLWLDTEITSTKYAFENLALDEVGRALLLFNSVNLKNVIAIHCTDEANLEIQFENSITLIFSGTPKDETVAEPWSIGSTIDAANYSIIALYSGGYAIFGGDSVAS